MTDVLLVDDHPLFRQALRSVVEAAPLNLAVHEAGNLGNARAFLKTFAHIALVLLDLKMPDCEGFAGLLQLKGEFPTIPIIIISTSDDLPVIARAIALGAAGYVPKSSSRCEIATAIKTVLSGEIFSSPLNSQREISPLVKAIASLSPAQLRTLMGLRRGMRNKEIAFEMNVSEKTVKGYMTSMFRILGVTNRTQALIAAQNLLVETTPKA